MGLEAGEGIPSTGLVTTKLEVTPRVNDCKVCNSPTGIRDNIERARAAGFSYRDAAKAVKAINDYDISHASIQRHEVSGHFNVDAVLASTMPAIVPENLTIQSIVDHKVRIWFAAHKDDIPTNKEMQDWFSLYAKFADANLATAKAQQIRKSFE